MTLDIIIDLIPNHQKIGIVLQRPNNKFNTLYSGYKGSFIKYCNHNCICPLDYDVVKLHSSTWDLQVGLVIGVKSVEEKL